MEIRNVNNEIINEYPKMTEFNKKDLKKYIPQKWAKIGVSSFVFEILMRATKSKAINANKLSIDGGLQVQGVLQFDPMYELLNNVAGIFKGVSIILLIISIILTTIKKHKNRNEKTTELTNKKMKIFYIITGIFILITIGLIIVLKYLL